MRLRSGADTSTARNQSKLRPKSERTKPSKRRRRWVEQSDLSVTVEIMAEPAVSSVDAELLAVQQELKAARAELKRLSTTLDRLEVDGGSQARIDDLLEDKKTLRELIKALTERLTMPVRQLEVQHEEKKMEMEFGENEKKRKHVLELTACEHEQERFRIRNSTTLSTVQLHNPQGHFAKLLDQAIVVPDVTSLFAKIGVCVSGKTAERSMVALLSDIEALPEQPVIQPSRRQVDELIVENSLSVDVQHEMLAGLNQNLGEEAHFYITDDSRASHLNTSGRPGHLVTVRADSTYKTAVNIAMIVTQKAKHDVLEDFAEMHEYLQRALAQAGPGRTHVMGVIMYRVPHVTRATYSRLVVDVWVLFHSSRLPSPHLLRLAEAYDAAAFFTEVGSPETAYANLMRSFAIQSFQYEAVEDQNFKCVRFLGTGAGTTDVWECVVQQPGSEEVIDQRWSDGGGRGSHMSSECEYVGKEEVQQAEYVASYALKRSRGETEHFKQEATTLKVLAEAFSTEVGNSFPELVGKRITHEGSILVTRPVCHKVMRGRDIRRAHAYDKVEQYLKSLGALFVDYVTLLHNCHSRRLVHRDITLRNLMWHRNTSNPDHPRQGCIIDWECADFFQVDTRLTVKHAAGIRVSLDTATSRYVETGTYGPSDDLVALVHCWKIATQLETHKATKNWSQLPATIEHFRTTINVYWMQNSRDCALTEMAKKEDYTGLATYFANPEYIKPHPPSEQWQHLVGSETLDDLLLPGYTVRYRSLGDYLDKRATEKKAIEQKTEQAARQAVAKEFHEKYDIPMSLPSETENLDLSDGEQAIEQL